MMDEKLYLAPIKPNPQNVLDLGTGTGLWAIEFGELSHLPSAKMNIDMAQRTRIPQPK